MSRPATYFFLTIEYDNVVVKYDGTSGGKVTRPIRDIEDYRQFFISKADEAGVDIDNFDVMCSSSIDFPEEHTKNPKTINLAREIRS
jgi:hypothetical protein